MMEAGARVLLVSDHLEQDLESAELCLFIHHITAVYGVTYMPVAGSVRGSYSFSESPATGE
jgi:hypothetical protein